MCKPTTCSYFDYLKIAIFDAVILSATLPRLHLVLGDFHVPTDTLVQKLFDFYFSYFFPCLALNVPKWLKVSNNRYHCSEESNACSTVP